MTVKINQSLWLSSEDVEIPRMSLSMARRSLQSGDYDAFLGVKLKSVFYESSSLRIQAYVALPDPDVLAKGPRPAIIFNRGGVGPRGALTPVSAMATIGIFAAWGYVAVASNYRGFGGSEGVEEWGAGDLEDSFALAHLTSALDFVDSDRMGLIGGSRGGMMALMMLRRSSMFRAAVTFGAPTALHRSQQGTFIRRTVARFIDPDKCDEELAKRSAVVWANELSKSTPLLVIHGTGDRRVDPLDALRLARELQSLHHPYKLIMYDNADHVLAGRRQESNYDIREWVNLYVMNKSPLPKTGPHGA